MITLGTFEYDPADVLGSGAFAIVYKGRSKTDSNKKVAIKRMHKRDNSAKSRMLLNKEISVLKGLSHENIVQLYAENISPNGVYLVMEFCNGGDLADYLQKNRTLSEDTIQNMMVQIGGALCAMNERGIIHRDLKPGNILLDIPPEAILGTNSNKDLIGPKLKFKLADFGFARFLQEGVMAATLCGSPMYMAPEVLMCLQYNGLADIWSMGIIVYQCLTGRAPFFAQTPEELRNIYAKTVNLRPKIPERTSTDLKDLLLKMLIRQPAQRIGFKQLLLHPFLKKPEPAEPIMIHRKDSIGADLRIISNSPRENIFPATSPTGQGYLARTPLETVPDDPDDFVVINHNEFALEDHEAARRLFQVKPQSIETSENLLQSNRLSNIPQSTNTAKVGQQQSQGSPLTRGNDGGFKSEPQNIPKSVNPTQFFVGGAGLPGMADMSPATSPSPGGGYDSPMGGGAGFSQQPQLARIRRVSGSNMDVNGAPTSTLAAAPPGLGLVQRVSGVGQTISSATGAFGSASRLPAPGEHYPPNQLQHQVVEGSHAGVSRIRTTSTGHPSQQAGVAGQPQYGTPTEGDPSLRGKRCFTTPADLNELPTNAAKGIVYTGRGRNPSYDDTGDIDPALYAKPPELTDVLLDEQHNEEVKKMTMVLDLCELITQLAEQRGSPQNDLQLEEDSEAECGHVMRYIPLSERVAEQILLYRRVLTYLQSVFLQMKNSAVGGKLHPSRLARRRLKDLNSIYHRCFIRLRHLVRESQREDLVEECHDYLNSISADRLIFQYAISQCSAAEMDEVYGDMDICLQRYKAAITLLHGLSQHAATLPDKESLGALLSFVQERYASLWSACTRGVPFGGTGGGQHGFDSPQSPLSVSP